MSLPVFLACLIWALTGFPVAAQSPLEALERTAQQPALDFPDFQQQFWNWRTSHDLSQEKGWKWLGRWEWEQSVRMNPDGSLHDPADYARGVAEMEVMKATARQDAQRTGANTNWFPVGPDDYATAVSPSWEPGIGRINCIEFHPTLPNTFWVGVAQGGVWRTDNGGSTWTPLTDELPTLRVSDIEVNPQNPDEIYISMGDYAYLGAGLTLDNRKRHTHYGIGVYKTTNGGASWTPTGLSIAQTDFDFSLTRRCLVHPQTPTTVVAAGTHGIYRSTDAGANWTQILDSLIWDLEQDPSNPDVLYASSGFRSSLNQGSAGMIKSTDFGQTWQTLPLGVPAQNAVQRIEIGISPSNSSTVYALCSDMSAGFYGLYRSTDAGATWTLRSDSPNILHWGDGFNSGGQGWYDLAILVHPTDPDIIYTGGINCWGSTDGGQTWDGVSYWLNYFGNSLHADQHQFKYNPVSQQYYICNDGGLYAASQIVIGSWADANNQPGYLWPTSWTRLSGGMQATSFYRLSVRKSNPDQVIAGAQDNSTYYNTGNNNWFNIIGGDGMECILHPTNPQILYGSSQYGNLVRSDDGGQSDQGIAWDITENGEWTTPFVMHPTDPNTLYAGYGNIWKTTNQGSTWNTISNFPHANQFGQPMLTSALALAPSDPNYIYAAKRFWYSLTVPASFWVTTDGGQTWNDRSSGLPPQLYYTYVAVDGDDPATAWVTTGGFEVGQKVWKTTDAGANWTNISGNLPNLPANCVVHDAAHPYNPVYVGMDAGVYYTNDTMAGWVLYADGLPNVIVSELEIHEASEQLFAATFGRAMWAVSLKDAVGASADGALVRDLAFSAYPNPAEGSFSLRLSGEVHASGTLDLLDVKGRRVWTRELKVQPGETEVRLSPDLPAGLYYARFQAAGLNLVTKVVLR